MINVFFKIYFVCVFKGFILRFPIWGDPADDNCYDDEVYWEVCALFLPLDGVLAL